MQISACEKEYAVFSVQPDERTSHDRAVFFFVLRRFDQLEIAEQAFPDSVICRQEDDVRLQDVYEPFKQIRSLELFPDRLIQSSPGRLRRQRRMNINMNRAICETSRLVACPKDILNGLEPTKPRPIRIERKVLIQRFR